MLANDLVDFLSGNLIIRPGTVADRLKSLRSAGLVAKGRQGPNRGARMGNSDSINALLASLIDHGRGDDVAANVRRLRALPFAEKTELNPSFAKGLSFTHALTFGDALDSLLNDIRGGAYDRVERSDSYPLDLSVSIDHENGDASLSLSRTRAVAGAGTWCYRLGLAHKQPTWRQIHIRGDVFLNLAEKMGPPIA